jgi:hydrogenase/urease accessory protein HupE
MPATLATILSGVDVPDIEVGVAAAVVAICLWAAVPAAFALLAVRRRDVI